MGSSKVDANADGTRPRVDLALAAPGTLNAQSSVMPPREPTVQDIDESGREPNAVAVVADAIQHARELVHAEFALAKAELKEELSRIQAGAMAVAFGVTFGAASLLIAIVALVIQLDLDAWIVALAGACAALAGGILAWWGQRRLVAPRLALTRGALARGASTLKQVTDVKHDSP